MDMGTILFIAVVLLIVWRFMPVKGVENVTPVQLQERMKNSSQLEVIDVREPHEYKSGHISRAKNIPLSKIAEKAKNIPRDKEIALVCRSGNRSMIAAKRLKKLGYEKLTNVRGGMTAWNGPVRK